MGKKKDELCKNNGSKYYYDSFRSIRKIHFRIEEPLICLFLPRTFKSYYTTMDKFVLELSLLIQGTIKPRKAKGLQYLY